SSALFLFTHPPPTEFSTLSLHDALPIYPGFQTRQQAAYRPDTVVFKRVHRDYGRCLCQTVSLKHRNSSASEYQGKLRRQRRPSRSEEHTSELQSLTNLVCRLLLEKKKTT